MYTVKPIEVSEKDPDENKPILGAELTPWKYGSIVMVGRTGQGKTTIIKHLLDRTIDDRTTVWLFCSTVNIDKNWREIIKQLEERDIKVHTFHHLRTEEGRSTLKPLLAELERRMDERQLKKQMEEAEKQPSWLQVGLPVYDLEPEPEPPKRKTQVCENLIILDDLDASELSDKSVVNAMKKCRHYQVRLMVSSQHLIHFAKSAWEQTFLVILLKGISHDYIEQLNSRLPLGKRKKHLLKLYEHATQEDRRFLSIYVREDEYRQDFYPRSIDVAAVLSEQ